MPPKKRKRSIKKKKKDADSENTARPELGEGSGSPKKRVTMSPEKGAPVAGIRSPEKKVGGILKNASPTKKTSSGSPVKNASPEKKPKPRDSPEKKAGVDGKQQKSRNRWHTTKHVVSVGSKKKQKKEEEEKHAEEEPEVKEGTEEDAVEEEDVEEPEDMETEDEDDEEDEVATEEEILRGCQSNLPKANHNTVRLYVASHFSDFSIEKNCLQIDVVPELREYCQNLGLEFQMVDLRLGAREDIEIDHYQMDMCFQEMQRSKQFSTGPFIVVLVGDKYGSRPYPCRIESKRFQMLYDMGKLEGKEVLLLDEWFQRDDNVVPPAYILQPVTTRFPFYNDESEANKARKKKDQDEWAAINQQLTSVFQAAAKRAMRENKLTERQMNHYLHSSLETEVVHGILKVKKCQQKALCLIRSFTDINTFDKAAKKYTMIEGSEIDESSNQSLEHMKERIKKRLPQNNVFEWTLPWHQHGLTPTDGEHAEYIKQFTSTFSTHVKRLVNDQVERREGVIQGALLNEVLCHSWYAQEKVRGFRGRADILNSIKKWATLEYEGDEMRRDGEDNLKEEDKDDEEENNEDGVNNEKGNEIGETKDNTGNGDESVKEESEKADGENVENKDIDENDKNSDNEKTTENGSADRNDDDVSSNKIINEDKENESGNQSIKKVDDNEITKDEEIVIEQAIVEVSRENTTEDDANEDKKEKEGTDHDSGNESEENVDKDDVESEAEIDLPDSDSSEDDELYRSVKTRMAERKKAEEAGFQSRRVSSCNATFQEEITPDEALLRELKVTPMQYSAKPVFVYGPSGCGKTSMMARLMTEADKWFPDHTPVKIARFVGLTNHSMSLRDILESICQQIWYVYDVARPLELDLGKDFTKLSVYFLRLLQQIDTSERPLVVVIDGVDALMDLDNALTMKWIPLHLPLNVCLILSMLPDEKKVLFNIRQLFPDAKRYVEMEHVIGEGLALEFLDEWSEGNNRKLPGAQANFILNKLKQCKQLLFLKIATIQALGWKSYTPKSDLALGSTVEEAISKIFFDLEKAYGKVVVSKVAGYITITKNGLSEAELEDILSCDDTALQDAYLYHNTPCDETIRIPQLYWQRFRHEMEGFIVYRPRDGKHLMSWMHATIDKVVRARYMKDEEDILAFHKSMVDYFLGKYNDKGRHIEQLGKKKATYEQAMHRTSAQPIIYPSGLFNLRKMSELPYHLVFSHQYTEFVNQICRRFDWLQHKCEAMGIQSVLSDLSLALKYIESAPPVIIEENGEVIDEKGFDEEEEEIQLLLDVLRIRADDFRKEPSCMATQLLGQLSPVMAGKLTIGLKSLLTQAQSWCESTTKELIVPRSNCLPFPGSELRKRLEVNLIDIPEEYLKENKLCMSFNGKLLLAVDHQKCGDFLLQFDMTSGGELTSLQYLPDRHVKRITFTEQDKVVWLENYISRDRFSTKTSHELMDRNLQSLTSSYVIEEVLGISQAGKYACVKLPFDPDTPLVHRPTATLLNLHTGSKTNLFYSKPVRVILALFSADEAFVVLLTQDAAYSFGVESGKVRHKWEEARKDGEFSHNTRERLQRCTHILSNNQLVIRGFDAEISKVIFRRDLRTGDTIYEMRGHIYPVDIIALNQEHTLAAVATTSPDVRTNDVVHKIVHIWDLEWGKMLSKVGRGVGSKGGSIVSAIAFCGVQDEYCITNCTDGEPAVQMWYIGIRLNPISPAIPIHELICHNRPIIFMQVANHGETLVTASMDNTVALWDLPKVYERCEKELQGQQKAEKVNQKILDEIFKNKVAEATAPYEPGEGMMVATSLSISKDGLVGVVGTRDGWVIFYNLETLEMTSYNRVAMRKPVNFMLTTKSGRFIISAATDLRVWIPETGELLHTFVVARRERIDSMAESNDVLVAGFSGRECCGMVWDLKSGLRLRRLEGLYGFSKVAITSDASKVVGVFFDFPMIFNVRSGEPENSSQMETAEYDCTCLRISPDDRMVVSASTDGSVKVMDFKTGMYRLRLQHQSPVLEALFSPDSSLVLTAGFKSVFIWSAHDGTQLGMLSEHQAAIEKLMFSVGDRFLLSCSRDRQVIVWDFESRTPVTNFHAHCPMTVMAVADDLTTVLFGPENISYVGILKSNPAFRMLIGDYVPPTPIEEKAPQDMD